MLTISMKATVIKGKPEDREKLSQIISAHKEWLEDPAKGRRACLKEMNLKGADFSGADLSGADLSGAFLMNAKMVETKLTGANLNGAYLANADCSKANLVGAQISYAKMMHSCFDEASMQTAIIRDSVLWDSDFKGTNLCGTILTGSELCDCSFEAANLDSSDLFCTDLDYTIFKGASLQHARLEYTTNSYYADFTDADVTGADFLACELNEENIQGAIGFYPHMRCPEEGSFIAWKKCRDNRFVKLLIPEDACRTGVFVEICRASKARVLEIRDQDNGDCEEAVSYADGDLIYRKGETVYPKDPFDDHLLADGSGIHFFLTRAEAELFEFHDDSSADETDETEKD